MADVSIASLIDDLLARDKELGGAPDWREIGGHGGHRLIVPVTLAGASTNMDMEINAYPDMKPTRFRIMLNRRKCIWRIDYVEEDVHVNSFDAPDGIKGIRIRGPHYHDWADNRRFCTQNNLPDKLSNARVIPDGIRSFNSALRWMCGLANIAQPPSGLIELPARTGLI